MNQFDCCEHSAVPLISITDFHLFANNGDNRCLVLFKQYLFNKISAFHKTMI